MNLDVTFIYVLKDPVTGDVRYVGKTDNPKHRLGLHLIESRKHKHRRACWVRSLLRRGLQPQMEVVDEVPRAYWQALEAAYIAFYRELGYRLTNSTPGGDGTGAGKSHPSTGRKWTAEMRANYQQALTPEVRAKLRAARLGKKMAPESIAKTAAANRGRKRPIAACQAVSRALRGIKRSDETKAKLRAAFLGTKASPETRAKLSAVRMGHETSAETRRKISAAYTQERKAELKARLTGVPRSLEVRQKIIRAKARGQLFLLL